MSKTRPNYIDSEWYDKKTKTLKNGAPLELVKEFGDYKKPDIIIADNWEDLPEEMKKIIPKPKESETK